jgi:hypothetical protein
MNVYNHALFIMTLGHSLVSNNQILQPNLAGANPSNSHFTDPGPQFSSIVGGVSGCGGAGGSAAALAGNGNPGYNMESMIHHPHHPHHHQKGGKSHRRGGYKKRSSNKRSSNKRSSNKRSGNKRSSNKRSDNKRSDNKRRTKRGGLSALSPTPFSGAANAPYHQFMGNQPVSYVYGLGVDAPIPPSDSWMASPPPMNNIHNSCGSNHGLVSKGLLN